MAASIAILNADIRAMDGRDARFQALAIGDGRILAVGSNDKVRGAV